MYHNRDILWKGLLELVFDDLLRCVLPNADEVFDMARGFSFLDKELEELYPESCKGTDIRFVDKLVKLYRLDGKEEWMLIHIEVQAETKAGDRSGFPERMFRYFYRIFDKYQVPVMAIAILTGRDGKKIGDTFEYDVLGTKLFYKYKTIRVLDYSDEELEDEGYSWIFI